MPTKPPQHRPAHWKPSAPWQRPAVETTTKRGYGSHWQKLRALVLSNEPWCRPCRTLYRHTKATQVDHIKPKAEGGTDDLSNLQPICFVCHKAKSSKEGNRAR